MAARTRFVLRFDDIAPGMAWTRFLPLKKRLEDMEIKVVLGVVPDCRDPSLAVEPARRDFFDVIRQWRSYGDAIAQHGTCHVYDTPEPGLLKLSPRSEFAGHPYDVQLSRLETGKAILEREGVWEPYFMAPSHSFDFNTLRALKALDFHAVTDGYGFWPYSVGGVTLVPQLAELPVDLGFGYQTLCLHVNTMPEGKVERIMRFVEQNRTRFCDFRALARESQPKPVVGAVARWVTEKGLAALRAARGGPW